MSMTFSFDKILKNSFCLCISGFQKEEIVQNDVTYHLRITAI